MGQLVIPAIEAGIMLSTEAEKLCMRPVLIGADQSRD
jgi:hypothetical protein